MVLLKHCQGKKRYITPHQMQLYHRPSINHPLPILFLTQWMSMSTPHLPHPLWNGLPSCIPINPIPSSAHLNRRQWLRWHSQPREALWGFFQLEEERVWYSFFLLLPISAVLHHIPKSRKPWPLSLTRHSWWIHIARLSNWASTAASGLHRQDTDLAITFLLFSLQWRVFPVQSSRRMFQFFFGINHIYI